MGVLKARHPVGTDFPHVFSRQIPHGRPGKSTAQKYLPLPSTELALSNGPIPTPPRRDVRQDQMSLAYDDKTPSPGVGNGLREKEWDLEDNIANTLAEGEVSELMVVAEGMCRVFVCV